MADIAYNGADPSEWSGYLILAGIGLAVLAVAWLARYFLFIRVPLWVINHSLYRIRVHGLENIPATGPALLVCNHVTFVDACLIQVVVRRPVRFLIWAPYARIPGLRHLLRLAKVIPVMGTAGPRAIVQSLRTASEALAKGELVCIFAEGAITRTGFLLPFQRGLEQIVKRSPAPIVPLYLDLTWGSIFSFRSGKFFWKVPRSWPYPVSISFGKPLPPTSTAPHVRQAIQQLSAEAAVRRNGARPLVHRRFVRQAARFPWRVCFVDPHNEKKPTLSYGEALAGVKILMAHLTPVLGDAKMVGLWLPPSVGGALANIVVTCLGKTTVNLNYTASPETLQAMIQQCGIKHVLTSKLFTAKLKLDPGPGVELVYLEDFRKQITTLQRLRAILSVWLVPGFIQERWLLGLSRHRGSDVATIIFSSGSTGEPKGVMLTHDNVAANAESMIQAIDPTQRDRLFGILPFFHSFGFTVTLWVPLQVGASAVYHPNPLQPKEIGDIARKHKATIFLSTPTFLRNMVRRCEPDDFRSLRVLLCGAEKLPQPLAQEFKAKFGIEPLEGYGCTELSPAAAANVPDFQDGAVRQIATKRGTIGQALPGVAARIVDRTSRLPLGFEQEGLLLIYGANVMKGYLDKEELTRKKIVDGWYITGDLAKMDEDGFITITGREERFAKVGGEMVPLEKVEEELHLVLGTNDRVCVLTAIPDERKGERLIVLHLPLTGTSVLEVWQKLGERGMPNLYVPGQRDFFQVDELPILGSGKVDIKKCKEQALKIAGK